MATQHPRLGAVEDLGLAVRWRHCFVAPGATARTQRGTVFLDVGGRIEPGVLDHHQKEDDGVSLSTAGLIIERPDLVYEHLMATWLDRDDVESCRGVAWNPRIVVHARPDVDAMVSTWLVRRLIEDGGLPVSARALADFTNEIDQGEFELDERSGRRLLGLLAATFDLRDEDLASIVEGGPEVTEDEARLLIGISILAAWDERFRSRSDDERRDDPRGRRIDLAEATVPLADSESGRVSLPALVALYERRIGDFVAAMSEIEAPRRFRTRLPYVVPPTSRETIEVAGIVLPPKVLESTTLALYFARNGVGLDSSEEIPDLVIEDRGVPRSVPKGSAARHLVVSVRPRIHMPSSIDPAERITRRPNLRGLGFKLETAEQAMRRRCGDDATKERIGPMRFAEFPNIRDPWYDGRGHGHSIVDAPWVGSLLSVQDVEQLVRRPFWEPEIARADVAGFCDGLDEAAILQGLEIQDRSLADLIAHAGEVLGADRLAGFRLLQLQVHPAWDIRSIDEVLNRFIGGRRLESEIEGSRYLFGPRGVVCLTPRDRELPDFQSLVHQITPIWTMQRAIRSITRSAGVHLGSVDGPGRNTDGPDFNIEHRVGEFVAAVSEYRDRSRRIDDSTGVRLRASIRDEVAEVIRIESQIEATDRLLEHLDDRFERGAGRRLNVVLMLVGILGVFEVVSALSGHFETDAAYPGWVAVIAEVVWWFILVLVITVGYHGFRAVRSEAHSQRLERWFGIRRDTDAGA